MGTTNIRPEGNFLQSEEWGMVCEKTGSKPIFEKIDDTGSCLMVVRNAKRGRYLEIACGPLIDWQDKEQIKKAFELIKKTAKAEKCVFVRLRPQLMATPENIKLLTSLGLKKSPMHLAAEHTVILDLTKSEDELLANMRRQTRYEVRRIAKENITVETTRSKEAFDEFFKVQQETAKRQNFIPPSKALLQAERECLGENINLYIAKKDGAPIAYGIMIDYGEEADYYEAASTELNHKLPGSYAIIWTAAKDFKAKGLKRFNLWGIAPKNQPNHRYAGVTTFKTGFGGEVIEFVSAHDLIINRPKYLKNWVIETARRKKRHL